MEQRIMGNSDLKVSELGIGALHFGTYCDQNATNQIIHHALDLGFNFIDTAPMYGQGQSEAFVKNAIQGRRDQILLSTKVGLEPRFEADGRFECNIVPLTKQRIRESLEKSLKALGTEYIDLYQIHAFDHKTPIEETMETLEKLVKEGKIRYIGCSNYDGDNLDTAMNAVSSDAKNSFVSLQTQYNLLERRAERDIVPVCQKHNVGLICNRALARGILSGKYQVGQSIPEGSRAALSIKVRESLSDNIIQVIGALQGFAKALGREVIELALAWLLARPQVSLVLVGVRNILQLETCKEAVNWKLSDKNLEDLDAILEKFNLLARTYLIPEVLIN